MQLLNLSEGNLGSRLRALNFRVVVLGGFIGAILFNRSVSIVFLAIFILHWLFTSSFQEKLNTLSKRRFLLLLPVFFLLYTLSLTYSENSGLAFLEKKILLFLIPLIVGSIQFSRKEVHQTLRIFIFACLTFTVVSFIEAYQFYNLPTQHFSIQHLPHQLSAKLHAPYLSFLLVLANLFILVINDSKKKFSGADILLYLYFSLFILILSSRTALFSNVSILIGYLYLKLVKEKRTTLFIGAVFTLAIIIALTFFYFPHFQERVTAITKVGNGISERATVFHASLKIILKNPTLGVGIGDIQPQLNQIYSSWNLSKYFFTLNPHNEYLYTMIALGVPAGFFLLYLLIYPVVLAFRQGNPLYAALYFIFLLAFLTEVVLARYWGVAAFSFFYTIFTANLLDRKNADSKLIKKSLLSENKFPVLFNKNNVSSN